MPTCKVNGVEITVPDGTNVLEAAALAGFDIPYFCYHPGLSAPANCRMCVIDVGGGRLAPSCYTPTADGGEYTTDSQPVKDFQKSNLEFILLNHPVDCAICDKSGECDLQDLYYQFSRRPSRLRTDKVHKPKVVPIGPEVVFDAERCILCTRCIRVCDEIAKEPQLCLINRGDRSQISVFPGTQLDHPYSLCTVDVCPVGALTSRDFRFRARAWYLDSTESICPGCSTGCNVFVDSSDGVLRRLRPRHNDEVNQWWMCDEGRYTYEDVQRARVMSPRTRKDGEGEPSAWTDALSRAADRLNLAKESPSGAVAVVASPWCTNEDLFALARFAAETLETDMVYIGGKAPGESDEILRAGDKNPNSAGVKAIFGAFGIRPSGVNTLLADLEADSIAAVYMAGTDLPADDDFAARIFEAAAATSCFVVQATNEDAATAAAHVVLPAAAWAEVDGTFTNKNGRVQQIRSAVPPKGSSRPGWQITTLLAQRMGSELEYREHTQVFRDLTERVGAYQGLTLDGIGASGASTERAPTVPQGWSPAT